MYSHITKRAMIACGWTANSAASQQRCPFTWRYEKNTIQSNQIEFESMKNKDEVIIRAPLPGEYGWIVQVHGQSYAEKFGWGEEFECIVAKIMVEYLGVISSEKQACFIAEVNGRPEGCVMLVENGQDEGKLRVMFVSENIRGRGVGTLLTNAVLAKAKDIGYKSLSLWTTNNQVEARELYKKIGFTLTSESPNTSFAKGSYDEEWKMKI